MSQSHINVISLIRRIPLKKMEASLLAQCIESHAEEAGHDLVNIRNAIAVASYLHRDQMRRVRGSLPRTHYIEHPLRNTVRLYRYGVDREHMIVAEIMHDTVEDQAHSIARELLGVEPRDGRHARELALLYMEREFGPDTSRLIRLMSNPIDENDYTGLTGAACRAAKHEAYRVNVRLEIKDPEVAVTKFSDICDNAFSLHHNSDPADQLVTLNLARKYEPLIDDFAIRLETPDVQELVSAAGADAIREHIRIGRQNLQSILNR